MLATACFECRSKEAEMNFDLTDQQRMVRELARDFADRELAPHAGEWDAAEQMPDNVVGALAKLDLLAPTVPEAYGGGGLDKLSYCLVVEELGRVDSSVRGLVSVSDGLVATSILRWGSGEQRRHFLPALVRGERLGCFALSEPDTGSGIANLKTRAVRRDGGWSISGSKMFITHGTIARFAVLFARTGEAGASGISCFLVPTDAEGFRSAPIHGKLGLRAQDTAELSLDDVRVPDDALLGREGEGFKVAMSALDVGRISLAAGAVGIAQACLDASVTYARERTQFGRPIGTFQLVQQLIADLAVETEAARMLTFRAALAADNGSRHTLESSMAKYFASEVAVRAANAAVQVHGGYGYLDEYPVGKCLRDARVTTLYEGTSQVQQLLIGRHLTGLNAFT
jgi:alkylation response protein AidB-like acyl-CoA dehydrogenase